MYKFLKENEHIFVIHLLREDLLAVLFSKMIATQTKSYHKEKKANKIESFTINPNNFQFELEKTISDIEFARNVFSKHKNYIEISFEDITKRGKIDDLLNFMGIDNIHLEHNFKTSQNSKEKYKYIENRKELEDIYKERMKNYSVR